MAGGAGEFCGGGGGRCSAFLAAFEPPNFVDRMDTMQRRTWQGSAAPLYLLPSFLLLAT